MFHPYAIEVVTTDAPFADDVHAALCSGPEHANVFVWTDDTSVVRIHGRVTDEHMAYTLNGILARNIREIISMTRR